MKTEIAIATALTLTSSMAFAWDPDGTGTADDIVWDDVPLTLFHHSRNDSLWMIGEIAKECATHKVNASVSNNYTILANTIAEEIGQDYEAETSTRSMVTGQIIVARYEPEACLATYGRLQATFDLYERTKGKVENPFAVASFEVVDPSSPTTMNLTPPDIAGGL